MTLQRLIYVSKPVGFTYEMYDDILSVSRRNNARDYVTGALLYDDYFNLQLLEGPRGAVNSCFFRIIKDKRHRDIHIIAGEDVTCRLFAEWQMHGIAPIATHSTTLMRYAHCGVFNPYDLSHIAAVDLCRTISEQEVKEFHAAA